MWVFEKLEFFEKKLEFFKISKGTLLHIKWYLSQYIREAYVHKE